MLYCYMDIKYAILLCGYQVCYIAMWISSVLYCYADIKHTFPCYVDITVDIHITGDINIPMSARIGRIDSRQLADIKATESKKTLSPGAHFMLVNTRI